MSHVETRPVRSFEIQSPFGRLAALLGDTEPGAPLIDLGAGGPRHPMPDFVMETMAEASSGFGQYPAIWGTDDFRSAIAEWLGRRYPALDGKINREQGILPLCGTREGLFSAVIPAVQRRPDIDRPAVLIPNPFYQTYAAGALVAGAEPVYLPADERTGFLPDIDAISDDLLDRTVLMFLCSPSNPQGAVASAEYMARLAQLARERNFMVFADECYSEIYTREAPPGMLEEALKHNGDVDNVVTFQSLSKRSNLPGLRSGFCAGDAGFTAALAKLRNVAAPQLALPVQHASAAVWRDEEHVEANRALYRTKFDVVDQIIGDRFGYKRPEGGFFLWLDVADYGGGAAVTKTLWQECGVKVVPGEYLAQTGADGVNPGKNFIRVAMVASQDETREALTRMIDCLEQGRK